MPLLFLYRVHEGKRPLDFTCVFCTKTFTNKTYRDNHMIIVHEGVELFKCTFCGKSFTQKQYLQNHTLRFHVGIKEESFKCQHCDIEFNLMGNLKIHIDPVHNKTIIVNANHAEKALVLKTKVTELIFVTKAFL